MMKKLPNLNSFSPNTKNNIKKVFETDYDDDYRKKTLQFLEDHPDQVEDAFGSFLHFGTAGMRALTGVGYNRINEYTIEMATQGLANHLQKSCKNPSVFISYDNRKDSFLFAKRTAQVLAANGIKAYIVKNLRPTPICSFGCRYYKCSAAVMITASHNDPRYNGYKVYGKTGGQVLAPEDDKIIQEIEQIQTPEQVLLTKIKNPLIIWVDQELDEAYLAQTTLFFKKIFGPLRKSCLRIVYSNLHGTGITIIPKTLESLGFTNLVYVKEQLATDPDFPAAKNPNPEELATLEKGIDLMVKKKADIFLASDPDADRIAVVAMHDNTPMRFSGNQIACICLDCLLHQKESLPKNTAFIKSIVTTELFAAMCRAHNYPCYDVPTGFKYIAKKIQEWEKSQKQTFVFGAEESLGYLLGTFVRDKDAALAASMIALATDYAKKQKLSLYSLLKKIYASYGVYREKVFSLVFPVEKKKKIDKLVEHFRSNLQPCFGPFVTKRIEDYKKGIAIDIAADTTLPLEGAKTNMIRYVFQDSSFVLRASGTEPKIKCYLSAYRTTFACVDTAIDECEKQLSCLEELIRAGLVCL